MTEEGNSARESALDTFLTRVNNLQLLVAAIVAQFVPALLALSVADPTAKLAALLLALTILIGAFVFWRAATKRKAAKAARDEKRRTWSAAHLQAAFRGLYSYTRRDELPGKKRQQLGRSIATKVANPNFRYGLVSGEIGAGKSSLLDSAVCKELEKEGYSTVLIRGLQDCGSNRTLSIVLDTLRRRLEEIDGEPVLVIDQFEELLIEWPSSEDRQVLGGFLDRPLPDRLVRVLCSVRSDYIIGMHDLAPALPDPTSTRSMSPVNNLGQEEATEIIMECSGRDGMEIDADLARAIAADLSHGGSVRPPELQLVCQGLSGAEPERIYRESGGARGILSDYVKKALESSLAPAIARLALRALCNLEATPPAKMPAQSAGEIADAIGARAAGMADLGRLQLVLRHLGDAGLVNVIGTRDEPGFALTHDYLVQPVILATSEVSTQAEKATQLLKLHIAENIADPKSRIPFRRLRFIRRHADRELLSNTTARKLLRRSYLGGAGTAVALIGLAATGVVALVLWQMVAPIWHREQVGAHLPDGTPRGTPFVATADGREVLSDYSGITFSDSYVSWWDARTGRLLWRSPGIATNVDERRGRLLFQPNRRADGSEFDPFEDRPIRLADRLAGPRGDGGRAIRSVDTPLPPTSHSGYQYRFSLTGDEIIVWKSGTRAGGVLQIWSPSQRRFLASRTFPLTPTWSALVGRVAVLTGNDSRAQSNLILWNDMIERRVPLRSVGVAIDRSRRFVAGIAEGDDRRRALVLWNLATTAELIRVPLDADVDALNTSFTGDGRFLLLFASDQSLLAIYSVPRLARVPFPLAEIRPAIDAQSWQSFALGRGRNGRAAVWNFRSSAVRPVDFAFAEVSRFRGENPYVAGNNFLLSPDGGRAIILSQAGIAQMYDTGDWRRIPIDGLPEHVTGATFTADGSAAGLTSAGGDFSLVDLRTGAMIEAFRGLGPISVAYYDRDCGRIHFWTRDGLVLRYTLGRRWPIVGFRASAGCS